MPPDDPPTPPSSSAPPAPDPHVPPPGYHFDPATGRWSDAPPEAPAWGPAPIAVTTPEHVAAEPVPDELAAQGVGAQWRQYRRADGGLELVGPGMDPPDGAVPLPRIPSP